MPMGKNKSAIYCYGSANKVSISITVGHSWMRDQRDPTKILDRFMEHLEPWTNHRIHRYTLQGMRQDQGESVDNFTTKMKNIGVKCKFNGNEEFEDRLLDQ